MKRYAIRSRAEGYDDEFCAEEIEIKVNSGESGSDLKFGASWWDGKDINDPQVLIFNDENKHVALAWITAINSDKFELVELEETQVTETKLRVKEA